MRKKCFVDARKMLDTEWTVVLFRNGRLGVVMEHEENHGLYIFGRDKNHLIFSSGITRVRDYDENLYFKPDDDFDELHREYDIMALYCDYLTPLGLKRILFAFKDPSDIVWDWEREEVKEVTMADIEEVFGCKVKIVKEKENE